MSKLSFSRFTLMIVLLFSLSLAITEEHFLLADKADGKPLFGENGSLRLVIPTDKRGARSVRMLSKLEIVPARK